MRRAKILCTLGPSSSTAEMIEKLMLAGMDAVRLNFSHGSREDHQRMYNLVREASNKLRRPVAVVQDLQGPKIRIGKLGGGKIMLEKGTEVTIINAEFTDKADLIPCTYPIAKDVIVGDQILLDDGRLKLQVVNKDLEKVRARVVIGGELSDNKGVNLPGVRLSIPAVTDKDRSDLEFGVKLGVDYVALSFVRSADDVALARKIAPHTPLIAKIEKPEAVDQIDSIIDAVEGIMIARGDLGVEMGPERVPILQKQLIEQTNRKGKLAITATEMLDSMRYNSRPTRAEVSDVANAILDGSDAVMLSGETASGKYPLEAVQTMATILTEIEGSQRFKQLPEPPSLKMRESMNAIARAAVAASREIDAKAIICYTETGNSAILISKYRPSSRIITIAGTSELFRRLALEWGVMPMLVPHIPKSTEEAVTTMVSATAAAGYVAHGDVVVLTDGVRDMMKILTI